MQIKDIVRAFSIRHKLIKRIGSEDVNDPAPILPFLIMDCAQSIFFREVSPLHTHHSLEQLKNRWIDDYHRFNQKLFSCLDTDQRDFVIDVMDEYEVYVQDEILSIREAINDLLIVIDLYSRSIICSLFVCNILSQVAQIAWSEVFRTEKKQKEYNIELQRMRSYTHKMLNLITELPENIDPNEDENLNKAIGYYMDKTTKWLVEYDKKQL